LSLESGATAVYFGLTAPIWIGGVGLATEVGTWYYHEQQLQSTADAVADSLAGRIGTGADSEELQNIATQLLQNNMFNPAKSTIAVDINPPPVNGKFNDGTRVTITLTRTF